MKKCYLPSSMSVSHCVAALCRFSSTSSPSVHRGSRQSFLIFPNVKLNTYKWIWNSYLSLDRRLPEGRYGQHRHQELHVAASGSRVVRFNNAHCCCCCTLGSPNSTNASDPTLGGSFIGRRGPIVLFRGKSKWMAQVYLVFLFVLSSLPLPFLEMIFEWVLIFSSFLVGVSFALQRRFDVQRRPITLLICIYLTRT